MNEAGSDRGIGLLDLTRTVLLVGTFALTAVGWRVLGSSSAGVIRYFHLPMVMVVILGRGRLDLLRRIEDRVVLFGLYSLVYVSFAWYHGAPPLALQQGAYLVLAFTAAAHIRTASPSEFRILRWTGPLALLVFSVFFYIDAAAAGVDLPGSALSAVLTGNTNQIEFGIFQAAFNAASPPGVFNSGALRGQILAGVLVSLLLSVYAHSKSPTSFFRPVLAGTSLAVVVLCVFSLARFLLVILALTALLAGARMVLRGGASPLIAMGTLVATVLVALVLITPAADLLYRRIAVDTGSYQERTEALEGAIVAIEEHPIIGSFDGGDAAALASGDRSMLSAHNFVLDATVIGGVLTGSLALAVLLRTVADVIASCWRYLDGNGEFASAAAGLLTPVVMFTAGSGLLSLPELLGLALCYVGLTGTSPRVDEDASNSSDFSKRMLAI